MRKNILILAAFAAVLLFSGLNFRELFSGDETRVAGIIAEMAVSGDLVTPRLNGSDFLEYPPLYYQLGSGCFRIFGFTDAAAKLPSAVCAFGAALLVFALARRFKLSENAALAAGVMLLTGAQFFNNGRKCMVDMMLAFFVLLTLYAFHALLDEKSLRKKALFFLLYSGGLAGGFMTKSLIGWAFPWSGLGIWLIADDLLFAKRFTFKRYLLLGIGVIPALIPICFWLYRLHLAGGRAALDTVLIENGIGRFTGAQGDHIREFWYYLAKLPSLFQPWLLIFLAALVYAAYLLRKKRLDREILPPLCEAVVPFILLSCAASKRQVYLLPIYPAWAILAAWFLIDKRSLLADVCPRLKAWAGIYWRRALWSVGTAALAVFAFLAPAPWAKAFPVLAIVALTAGLALRNGRGTWALWLAGALFYVSIDAAVIARKNRRESLRPLFAECERYEKAGYLIRIGSGNSERTRGAAVFYLKKQVPEVPFNTPIKAREKRIVRLGSKTKAGRPFADKHYLLGAEENPALGKLCKLK